MYLEKTPVFRPGTKSSGIIFADSEYLAKWYLTMANELPTYVNGFTGKGLIVTFSNTGFVLYSEFKNYLATLSLRSGIYQAGNNVAPRIDRSGELYFSFFFAG